MTIALWVHLCSLKFKWANLHSENYQGSDCSPGVDKIFSCLPAQHLLPGKAPYKTENPGGQSKHLNNLVEYKRKYLSIWITCSLILVKHITQKVTTTTMKMINVSHKNIIIYNAELQNIYHLIVVKMHYTYLNIQFFLPLIKMVIVLDRAQYF